MDPTTRPLDPDEVDLSLVTKPCADGEHRKCPGRVRIPGKGTVDCACPVCDHPGQRQGKRVQPTPLRHVFRDVIADHPDAGPDELADQLVRALQNYRRRLADARRRGLDPPDEQDAG